MAKASAKTLRNIAEEHFEAPNGLGIFALEMAKAAESVQSLDWEAVRKDKFHLTSVQLFHDLARNAEALVRRHEHEHERRIKSLQPAVGVDESAVGERGLELQG